MNETDMHPTGNQQSLAFRDGVKKRQDGPVRTSHLGEVTIDHVPGEPFNGFHVAAGGEILERPDANVARCDAGQHGSRQPAVAENRLASRDGRQRPGGRNSERMHRLADEIFAQHWA